MAQLRQFCWGPRPSSLSLGARWLVRVVLQQVVGQPLHWVRGAALQEVVSHGETQRRHQGCTLQPHRRPKCMHMHKHAANTHLALHAHNIHKTHTHRHVHTQTQAHIHGSVGARNPSRTAPWSAETCPAVRWGRLFDPGRHARARTAGSACFGRTGPSPLRGGAVQRRGQGTVQAGEA